MKAELKRVHSPDIYDLKQFVPDHPDRFGFLLQAMIGPKGTDGEESFDILVCTPKWLEDKYDLEDVIIGRHHFIVLNYDYKKIISTIEKYLMHCAGSDWNEVATKVSRLGRWEFEDYVPSQS